MHTADQASIVLEDDLDNVADLSPNERPQYPQVLPAGRARFERSEGVVGVLAIDGFQVSVRLGLGRSNYFVFST